MYIDMKASMGEADPTTSSGSLRGVVVHAIEACWYIRIKLIPSENSTLSN